MKLFDDEFDINVFLGVDGTRKYINYKDEAVEYQDTVSGFIDDNTLNHEITFSTPFGVIKSKCLEEADYPDYGGEIRMVFTIEDEEGNSKTFMMNGHYQSHYGTEWEGAVEVEERPVTRVEYVEVKHVDWKTV